MKFESIDFSEKLSGLSFAVFKKSFKKQLDKLSISPETVYKKLGGKLPEKKSKDGS